MRTLEGLEGDDGRLLFRSLGYRVILRKSDFLKQGVPDIPPRLYFISYCTDPTGDSNLINILDLLRCYASLRFWSMLSKVWVLRGVGQVV